MVGSPWESLGLQGDPTSPSYRKSTLNIHWKDCCWSWSSNIWPPDEKNWLSGKDPDAGKDRGQEEKGTTEDEMVWWCHQGDGHEFEQTPGDGKQQGSLTSLFPQGCKMLDTTEQLNDDIANLPSYECFRHLCKRLPALTPLQKKEKERKKRNRNLIVSSAFVLIFNVSIILNQFFPLPFLIEIN